ncbi:MAG: AbrB/MazE/SpoVT family DNA-binding domain-containing protein [Acidobacteria bacterium]|nr:AbrB/MazE/SpoVT family DNA-binding domain-containing protein [Acidobacteriota bacterium]
MKTRVHRCGSSLAVRIPRTMAQDLGLTSGSGVEISVRYGSLVIEGL